VENQSVFPAETAVKMKRFFLLILPVLIIILAGFAGITYFRDRAERLRMMDELARKVKALAESSESMVLTSLKTKNYTQLKKFAGSFEKRERIQGALIYETAGKKVIISSSIKELEAVLKQEAVKAAKVKKSSDSVLETAAGGIYSYAVPVIDNNKYVLGAVVIAHDASYIDKLSGEMWRLMALYMSLLALLLIIVILLLSRTLFIMPLIKLTEWFKKFQSGEINYSTQVKSGDEFEKLINEVEQVALSLRIAKKAANEEASIRTKKTEAWNDRRLKDLVKAKIGDNAFFVVSNREPYMHVTDNITGKVKCIVPVGGVVTALDPVMRASGGTWIAHGSGDKDREFVNSRDKLGVPPDNERYILKRVWLTKEEEDGYYYGFSNEGLWPLCHVTHTRPVFRREDWEMYIKANRKFADAVLEELPGGSPVVFIQDYHFTLLPHMIKEQRPDAVVVLFWHIPWPNPEIFSICPYYKEILKGMLACDIVGFHTQFHCNNFLDTANRLLENRIDTEKFSVVMNGHETFIRPFPISVGGYTHTEVEAAAVYAKEKLCPAYGLEGIKTGVGVDRIDYTKGIVERITALNRFFEKYPEQKGRFTFIQIGAPSRTNIKKYNELINEIDAEVDKINLAYGTENWKPFIYIKKHLSYSEILPFYTMADLCIVSSLHDGMNLVAKEFVSAKKDNDGVLILSSFAGASRELEEALIINPYSAEEFADAIYSGLEMDIDERKRRMESMREVVGEGNVYKWAGSIIDEIALITGKNQ